MSTGLECEFIEVKRGEWYYVLQSGTCPVQCWDWREYDPTVRGPYPTLEAAERGLHRRHANPGGASIYRLDEGRGEAQLSQMMKDLIKGALKP